MFVKEETGEQNCNDGSINPKVLKSVKKLSVTEIQNEYKRQTVFQKVTDELDDTGCILVGEFGKESVIRGTVEAEKEEMRLPFIFLFCLYIS